MFKRLFSASLIAVLMASNSGCCLYNCAASFHNRNLGRNWCCSQCGETYWSEWFNDPPDCCDPCDCCANFTGHCCHHHCGPAGPYGPYGGMPGGPIGYGGPAMD